MNIGKNFQFDGEKEMKCCDNAKYEIIKKYDPKPKNPDGSIRWFLYRWDDGKDGYRKLVRCKNCNSLFLVQCYELNKFSNDNQMHEDWYVVKSESEADALNRKHTGIQLELKYNKL